MLKIFPIVLLFATSTTFAQDDWDNWVTKSVDDGCEVTAGIVLNHSSGETRFLIRLLYPADAKTEPVHTPYAIYIDGYDQTLLPGESVVIKAGEIHATGNPSDSYPHRYKVMSPKAAAILEALKSSKFLEIVVVRRDGSKLTLKTVGKHLLRHVDEISSCKQKGI